MANEAIPAWPDCAFDWAKLVASDDVVEQTGSMVEAAHF
jgi:hypothetical protein